VQFQILILRLLPVLMSPFKLWWAGLGLQLQMLLPPLLLLLLLFLLLLAAVAAAAAAAAATLAAAAAAVVTATAERPVQNNFPSLDAHFAGIRFRQFSLCQFSARSLP